MLKRAHASLDDEVAFLIEKINYILRKVESYDRALNEFAKIKLTIDEAEKNTRLSKDIVRNTKDSVNINSTDIEALSMSIKNLDKRFEDHRNHMKNVIWDLDVKRVKEYEQLAISINELSEQIAADLHSYLTQADMKYIMDQMRDKYKFLESCISNAHENNMNLQYRVGQLENTSERQKEDILSLGKDLCRFQNALVRKGVPVDIQ